MKEIWKFVLINADTQEIEMPIEARILSIQTQYDKPCIWALVDPKADKVTRVFEMYGTGHIINNLGNKAFIGTFQLMGGSLVFHLFEEKV